MIHTDNNRQVALACYSGSVDNHYPKYPLLRLFKDTSRYYLKLHLKIRWKLLLMLSQMALQEDKERRSYIQILHPPQQKYCAHTRLCSSTVWTCMTNQLFFRCFSAIKCFSQLCILFSNCFSFRNCKT